MAELFHKTFAVNLGEFSTTSAVNGTIEQSAGAGLNGTTGGVLYTRTAPSPAIYGVTAHTLSGLAAARFAWFIDLSSYGIATSTHVGLIWSPRTAAAAAVVAALQVINTSGTLYARFLDIPDGASSIVQDVSLALKPAWVEAEVIRETTDGANNGELRYYFGGGDYPANGQLVAEFLACQNYVGFNATVNARFGMVTGGSSVNGTLKIDEIIARSDNTPILYGVSASLFSPLTWLRRRRRA